MQAGAAAGWPDGIHRLAAARPAAAWPGLAAAST